MLQNRIFQENNFLSIRKLQGRVAFGDGASRGIGAAVAKLYAREGAHVILMARSQSGWKKLMMLFAPKVGGDFDAVWSEQNWRSKLWAYHLWAVWQAGYFVSNAGLLEMTPVAHSKIKDWNGTYITNVLSNVQMIRTLEPLLKASDAGRAIVVGSGMGVDPHAFSGQYGVSKAAVMFLFKTWAEETRQTNLRVNIIRPGAVGYRYAASGFPGGYQGVDLRTPDQVAPLFVELASSGCSRHGEIVTPADYAL